MSNPAASLLLYGAIVGVTVVAWARGSTPERIGGSLNLAATVLVAGIHQIVGQHALSSLFLVIDGLLALGFLGLALRYASLWLGGTMLLQGVQFSLHAFYLVTSRRYDFTYALVNNLVSWGIVLCIAAGVFATWRKVRKARAD